MVENHEEIVKTVKLQILHKYSIPEFLKNPFRQVGSWCRHLLSAGFPWEALVPAAALCGSAARWRCCPGSAALWACVQRCEIGAPPRGRFGDKIRCSWTAPVHWELSQIAYGTKRAFKLRSGSWSFLSRKKALNNRLLQGYEIVGHGAIRQKKKSVIFI